MFHYPRWKILSILGSVVLAILLALPNAVCTPHLGYVERDNYELYFGTAFDNVLAFAAGNPTNLADPAVILRG